MKEKPLAHLLLDVNDEATCLLDAAGRIQAMNDAAEQLTGYHEGELAGRPFPGRPRNVGDRFDAWFAWLLVPARQWIRIRIKRKDEQEIDADGALYRLGKDGLSGFVLKLRVTSSSKESAALEDIKQKLEAIFGGMADGLVLIDEIGRILFFSAGAEKLFGYDAREAMGENVKMLMPSPYREGHDGYLSAYRETGVRKIIGVGREVSGRRKDGSTFPMYLSIGEIWLEGRRFFVGVTHDLTKAKAVESRLWMLSAAIEQSPVAVMIASKSGLIEYVNSCFTNLTGYRDDEVIGQSPRLLQSAQTPREQYRRLWEAINAGAEWRGEIQDRRKNGDHYWASETIAPLRDEHGEITQYIAIQQDVTEQRHDKEALMASEERFRKVAELVGEWLWEQDVQGNYTYSSDAVRDILGLEPEEIIGRNYLSLLGDALTEPLAAPDGSKGLNAFHRIVNRYRHKDGRLIFTESSGAPVFDDHGRMVKWRGVDRDITARKGYEDALRVRNRAMEAVHVGIVISDARAPGYPNIYVNPALSRITGYTQDELLKGGMHMLQGPETDRTALAEIRHAVMTRQSCEVTLKNYRKNGEAFWNELFISPVPDESGEVTHYIGVQTDVTERRRAEESRRNLDLARQIQLSLLPNAPLRLPRLEMAGICVPASHVGGDYFDYFQNSGATDVIIADVSGHSVGAALIMTEVRSMVRAESRRTAFEHPAGILRDLNELLHDDLTQAELFITMLYCRFAPDARMLKYANAGHNPGLLLGANDSVCAQLDGDGLILGAKRNVRFEEREIALSAGDKLLFYTDGVVEAQDRSGAFYGLERLCQAFVARRALTPEAIMEKLLQDVKRFCSPLELNDDVAIVVAEVS